MSLAVPEAGPPLPGQLNFVIRTDSDWDVWLQFASADGPVDMTGYGAQLMWDEGPRVVAPPDLTSAAGGGITITSGVVGASEPNVRLHMDQSACASLTFRAVGYRLLVTDTSSKKIVWLEGTATLNGTDR